MRCTSTHCILLHTGAAAVSLPATPTLSHNATSPKHRGSHPAHHALTPAFMPLPCPAPIAPLVPPVGRRALHGLRRPPPHRAHPATPGAHPTSTSTWARKEYPRRTAPFSPNAPSTRLHWTAVAAPAWEALLPACLPALPARLPACSACLPACRPARTLTLPVPVNPLLAPRALTPHDSCGWQGLTALPPCLQPLCTDGAFATHINAQTHHTHRNIRNRHRAAGWAWPAWAARPASAPGALFLLFYLIAS